MLADVVGWDGFSKWLPDWQVTERQLGIALPDDYKTLLTTIPAGPYAGTLLLNAPTLRGHENDLLAPFREEMLSVTNGRNCPYAAFPKLPGLIPWASSNGPVACSLFWLADEGDPNSWPVVVWGADGTWEEYDVGVVAFLIAFVRGKLPSNILEPQRGEPAYLTVQNSPGAPNNTGR
ncbi:hypothetical protein JNUCC0626_01850 [Lentzea sp. JNUCC 0626]|uniref:hypothetical protein n=1 Tax=Lentzea sp. JNUCC 0626 TaxID=3367513 RepID=UPI003748F99D